MSAEDPAQPPSAPKIHRRSWTRRIALPAGVLLVLIIIAELFARFYLGLGDPPLYIADPEIEYLNKPSMHYSRFGNGVTYNAYSMRSGPITPKKTDANQFRILMIGDSVINGGALTDDSKLATVVLQSRLRDALKKDVYVANISAGSWGPPNELAYLKRFGLFDADILVIVFNSSDYGDVPTFAPIVGVSMEYPDHAPLLALQEGFSRYLLPRLRPAPPGAASPTTEPAINPDAANAPQKDVDVCQDAIRAMVQLARDSGVKYILIVQHPERRELGSPEWPGHAVIRATATQLGFEPIQLAPGFEKAIAQNQNPYRDPIHPNELGQQVIADTLFPILEDSASQILHK